MPEYIDREAVIESIKTGRYPDAEEDYEFDTDRQWAVGFNSGLSRAMHDIICAPAADVVPVVRCKDCEHLELRPELPGVPFCRVWQNAVATDEYCRRGKRRVDGGDGDA